MSAVSLHFRAARSSLRVGGAGMSSLVASPQRHRCPELLWGRLDGQVAAVTGLVPHQHPDEQVWMVRGQPWEGGGGGMAS